MPIPVLKPNGEPVPEESVALNTVIGFRTVVFFALSYY